MCGLRGQHSRINHTSHALYQLAWNTGSVALNYVALSHPLCCNDIALLQRLFVRYQRDMCTTIRIVLYSFDDMPAGLLALEVDNSNPPLVAAASMPHSHAAGIVTSTLTLALLSNGELQVGATFPEVLVDRPSKVADTGGYGLVLADGEVAVRAVVFGRGSGEDGRGGCGDGLKRMVG